MSWSITIPATSAAEFGAAVDEAREKANIPAQNEGAQDQAALAVKVVKEIVASGVIGNESKKFHGTLSGHANPGHEPTSGYANDMIYISIQQTTEA